MWASERRMFQTEGTTKYKGPEVGAYCFYQRNVRDSVAGIE